MSNLVRVILTFRNPSKYELIQLSNVIYKGASLSEQQIFIAAPDTNLIHYSYERLENLHLIKALGLIEISSENLKKFKEEYRQFKKDHEKFLK